MNGNCTTLISPSYARHVTQNDFFIALYPPSEYLSNDIWFVWVICSRSATKKKKTVLEYANNTSRSKKIGI